MTRLKKLLLVLLASTLALFGTIGVYGVGGNPYSSNLDSSTMNTLDNIIDLVERKGQSLSTQSYYNLISSLSNRLRYLDYELLSIRNSLGGNNSGGTTTETTCEWGYRGVSPAPPAPARNCRCGETVTVGGGVYECYEKTTTVPVTNPTPITPISNPYPPVNCLNHPAPPGTTAINTTYEILNSEQVNPDGFSFGYATTQLASFDLDKNKYITALVKAPNEVLNFKIGFENAEANFTTAPYTVSLSKCPGDFNVSNTEVGRGNCVKSGGAFNMRFTTKDNPTSTDEFFKCILEKGQTYYLNIIHSSLEPYSLTSCNDPSKCGVLYVERRDTN